MRLGRELEGSGVMHPPSSFDAQDVKGYTTREREREREKGRPKKRMRVRG